jgi:alpha-glucosidase
VQDGGVATKSDRERWWRSGVLYEIYPRSFADSDGDGHGDLLGVIERLDHLAWLGIDAIWLNSIYPSPDADWGYDVSDFLGVHPDLGDVGTLDRLIVEARERGIRVMLDVVPNHTSDRHPWFERARADRDSPDRSRYVWADPRPDGGPPNNWRSTFGGPAWTLDEGTGQYYLHNFLPEQPDLDWWNERVRADFDAILRFWLDRGVAGFRIDVAHGLVKDAELRDNPPATDTDHPSIQRHGLRPVHNMNRPEVHEIWRRWRRIVDAYEPQGILLGETWVFDPVSLASFYGAGSDELNLAMNFAFVLSDLGVGMRRIVEESEAALPSDAWPVWLGSNHDVGRLASRWCLDDPTRTRAALLMLLTLRGTPIIYAGDEIGMPDAPVPRERLRDPVGVRGWPEEAGRDGARTPMQWTSASNAGFTRPGVEPWLPIGDASSCNVADQREDRRSVLNLCRDLIGLRRRTMDLRLGSYRSLEAPDGVWMWARGNATLVAVNLSDEPASVMMPEGTVLIGTRRERDGERIPGEVRLGPWEGLVAASATEGAGAGAS